MSLFKKKIKVSPSDFSKVLAYFIIKRTNQLLDDKEFITKKVWVKKIIVAANENPIAINIVGQNYSSKFNISLTDMNKEDFIMKCQSEIVKLQIGLEVYEKRINGLINTVQSLKEEEMYTSTHGLSLKGA
jgi:hypothetical protein